MSLWWGYVTNLNKILILIYVPDLFDTTDRFWEFCSNRINRGQNIFMGILYYSWYQVKADSIGGCIMLP